MQCVCNTPPAYIDSLLNGDEDKVRLSFHEPYETHEHEMCKTAEFYVRSGGTRSYNVAF
jgi:hypothetical protein